eukprot:m.79125 g.79125  ORF g.79125 m.79125 type:complete len:535 (-) comp9267_c2_seq2:47-1651(-)
MGDAQHADAAAADVRRSVPSIFSKAVEEPQTVLLTGFGPFGTYEVNPSWELVKQFAGNRCGSLQMKVEEIPVEYRAVDGAIATAVKQKKDIALAIHVGVGRPGQVCLEQFARNQKFLKKDATNKMNGSDKCVEDGPDMLETRVDVTAVSRRCLESNPKVKVKVSTDAGQYLCEYIYYRSMHELGVPTIFVHVPPVGEPYDMSELLTAMKHVIARTVEEVCGNTVVPELLIGHRDLDQWVVKFFDLLSSNDGMATAVAAIKTLIAYIEASDAATLSELRDGIKKVIDVLTCVMPSKITSVSSGCELFLRFITLKIEASVDFSECKRQLVDTGNVFLQRATMGREKIARKGMQFVHDGSRVLTHSCSRVVLQLLLAAAKQKKRFTVFVTESRPYCQGHRTARQLGEHGIHVTVIPDAAVGHMLEKVDCVISGAEAIVESGGIINTIGSYQIALLANAANRPFYVVGESFKFVRLYPLSQSELPPYRAAPLPGLPEGLHSISPRMDYTPPALITLIVTDIGILTPSAVSDELIKLYC